MALEYDLSRIENWQELIIKDEEQHDCLNLTTDRLIWATIAVDLGEITQTNAVEFWTRMKFLEKIRHPRYCDGLSLDIIRRHIGLKVNVYSMKRKEWMVKQKKALESIMQTVEYNIRNN